MPPSNVLPAASLSNALMDTTTGHSSESLHNPAQRPPSGLKILTARIPLFPVPQGFTLPCFEYDSIGIQLRNTIKIEGKLDRCFRGHSHQATCYVTPRGVASEWTYQGDFDVMLVQISPSLIHDTVLHTFEHDPAHVFLRPHVVQSDALLYGIAQALLVELQSGTETANHLYSETLKQTLLVHVLRSYAELRPPPVKPSSSLSPARLRQVVEFVEAHLSLDLSLAELAALVHLSPYHFARAFKQTTGQSVHQYVIARRLAAGRSLLEMTALSITEIAEQVGFADHSHFARAFKRSYGVSPSSIARVRKNLHTSRTNLPAEPS